MEALRDTPALQWTRTWVFGSSEAINDEALSKKHLMFSAGSSEIRMRRWRMPGETLSSASPMTVIIAPIPSYFSCSSFCAKTILPRARPFVLEPFFGSNTQLKELERTCAGSFSIRYKSDDHHT
jgi:hypothetical protein